MKKWTIVLLLFIAIVCFSGCEPHYTPDPAVEQYLNTGLTAEKAFARLKTAGYNEQRVTLDKQEQQLAKTTVNVQADYSDKSNVSLVIEQTYEGEDVVDNCVFSRAVLQRNSQGKYCYTTSFRYTGNNDLAVKEEEMSDTDAFALAQSIVYSNNEVYDEGLYYGDLFMLYIYQYPAKSFYVDVENNWCVFDVKLLIPRADVDIKMTQLTKINEYGLLVYNYERYERDDEERVLVSEINPSYEYIA